jgi:uncharacterized protein YlxW (UPF0749 family)
MRKLRSQISVAIVFAILGFMLAYQFKVLMNQEKTLNLSSANSTDITLEIEQYQKQKTELEAKVEDLQTKVNSYEQAAAGTSDASKALLKELNDSRLLTGLTNVHGQGITIYLTPNSDLFGTSGTGDHITDKHLVYLVNELRFAGAEAISINDIRIVGMTGIRSAGSYILINDDERVSYSQRIVIKAIGDKSLLYSAMSFPEVFSDFKGISDVKFEKSDDISIGKYTKTYKFDFAKTVN